MKPSEATFGQSDGWSRFISNSVALVIVDSAAERLFSFRRLLILYLAGGLAGELAMVP